MTFYDSTLCHIVRANYHIVIATSVHTEQSSEYFKKIFQIIQLVFDHHPGSAPEKKCDRSCFNPGSNCHLPAASAKLDNRATLHWAAQIQIFKYR